MTPPCATTPASNPWLIGVPAALEAAADAPLGLDEAPAVKVSGPLRPHAHVPAPDDHLQLPRRKQPQVVDVWWLGVHGGAGENTLTQLLPGSRAAEHAWPISSLPDRPVVLVARTNANGLCRAQAAATQWAAGATPEIRLLGLVLIADAPGRLPPPLKTLATLVAGGVPRVWHLPWIEPLRLGADPLSLRLPRPMRRLLSDVTSLLAPPAHPSPPLEEVPHVAHPAARV